MPKTLKPCVFCGSTEINRVKVTEENERSSKFFFIQCGHCQARGSQFGAIAMLDGSFEEEDEDLLADAIDAWNNAGHPTVFGEIKRTINTLRHDLTLFKERFKNETKT